MSVRKEIITVMIMLNALTLMVVLTAPVGMATQEKGPLIHV